MWNERYAGLIALLGGAPAGYKAVLEGGAGHAGPSGLIEFIAKAAGLAGGRVL